MILVFADLKSPLIHDRVQFLNQLDIDIVLVHNADGYALSQELYNRYDGFKIIESPPIAFKYLRYTYSVFLTFLLLVKYRPKLIVVHWASRLFQTLPLILFSKKLIVSTMGSDINQEVDAKGIKYIFTQILLKSWIF